MKRMARRLVLAIEVAGAAAAAVLVAVLMFLWYANTNAGDYRREIVAMIERATGLVIAVDGPLRFALTPLPTLVGSDVRVANPPWSERAEMMRVARVEVGFSPVDFLQHRNRLLRLALTGADIHLQADRTGRANWWSEVPPGTPAPPPVDIVRLEITDSRIDYRDDRAGVGALIGVESAVAGLPVDGPFTVRAVGDWFGTPFTGRLSGGRFTDMVEDRALWPASWHLEMAGATLDARGTIDRPVTEMGLDLTLSMAGQRLSALAPVLGVALPEIGPYGGSVRLVGGNGHYRLSDINGHVGVSDLAGQLDLVTGGSRLRLDGSLQSRMLSRQDLTGTGPESWLPPHDGRVLDATPLPFEALQAVDGRLGLKVGRLVTRPLDLFNLETTIELADRRLTVQPLRAKVAGGRIDLAIEADARRQPPSVHIVGSGDGLASEILLPAFGMTLSPTGPFSIDLDLAGWGPSLRAFLGGASGRVRMGIGQGTLPVRHFDLIASDLVQAIMPWATRHGDRTELNCLAARFTVKDGLAVVQRLLIDTTRITVTGIGEINLGTERVDLKLDPRPKDPSLISLATRMRVTGTLSDYGAAPDAVGLAKNAAAGLALAIGELNPLALVLPFISIGTGVADPCQNEAADRPQSPRPEVLAPLDDVRALLDNLGHAITRGVGRHERTGDFP